MKPSPAIGVFKPDEARAIKRKVLGENYSDPKYVHGSGSKLGWYYGILTEELLPATNPLTGYTKATVNVLMYTEGTNTLDMEVVTDSATVYEITNRSPNISGRIGDVLLFRWIIKEWAPVWSTGSSGHRHGIVISSHCNGCYVVELGIWGGDPEVNVSSSSGSATECNICATVTGEGTSECGVTLSLPACPVIGLGEYVLAYHNASMLVPLIIGTACVLLPPSSAGEGGSSGGSILNDGDPGFAPWPGEYPIPDNPVPRRPDPDDPDNPSASVVDDIWSIVDGLQEHVVEYREEWSCCDGADQTQVETLISRTPIIFAAKVCAPISCGSCDTGSGSGSGSV